MKISVISTASTKVLKCLACMHLIQCEWSIPINRGGYHGCEGPTRTLEPSLGGCCLQAWLLTAAMHHIIILLWKYHEVPWCEALTDAGILPTMWSNCTYYILRYLVPQACTLHREICCPVHVCVCHDYESFVQKSSLFEQGRISGSLNARCVRVPFPTSLVGTELFLQSTTLESISKYAGESHV